MNYRNTWLNACFCKTTAKEIIAYFKHRTDGIRFTTAILQELKTDPNLEYIVDGDTGEIIYRAA